MSQNYTDYETYYGIIKLLAITCKEFLENTTLHGFKYLVQSCRTSTEKAIWYLIQLCAVAAAVYIFLHAWQNFTAKPTFTTLQSVKHPIWEVPFPAVSICSVNKISKKSARKYAEELAAKSENYSADWLFERVKYLGKLFDLESDIYKDYLEFQDVLDTYDFDVKTKVFDTGNKMERLAPKCNDILVRCQWGDSEVNCKDIFTLRKTWEGYCCLFNYVRPFDKLSAKELKKPLRSSFTGPNSGLIMILNSTLSDYYYPLRHTLGFSVHVFNAQEFPDSQTGSLLQLFVNPETEVFFKLDVTTVEAVPAVEQYSPEQRGCLFHHELNEQYAGHYSYADCLLKCKIRTIVALCNCMPFSLPTNFPDGTTSDVFCNLAHLKCLDKYKVKVNNFRPRTSIADSFPSDLEDSIECSDCFPVCSKTYYGVTATYSRVLKVAMENSPWELLQNLSTLSDLSIVHVYYPFVASTLYRTDVVMTWQEIVSSFGGLLGLCLGFSLISFVELVYFATVRLYENIPLAFGTRPKDNLGKSSKKQKMRQYVERMCVDKMTIYYGHDGKSIK